MHMLISHWQTSLQTSISSTYFSKEAKEKHLILRLSLQIPAAKSKPGMQDMSNMTMRFKGFQRCHELGIVLEAVSQCWVWEGRQRERKWQAIQHHCLGSWCWLSVFAPKCMWDNFPTRRPFQWHGWVGTNNTWKILPCSFLSYFYNLFHTIVRRLECSHVSFDIYIHRPSLTHPTHPSMP